MQRRNFFAGRLAFVVSSLYTNALMVGWSVLVTIIFLNHSRQMSLFPTLLLTYGAATGPWAFLASKDNDGGNGYSSVAVFFLEVGYVIGATLLLLQPENGLFFLVPMFVVMVVNWIFQQLAMSEALKVENALL